jgi:hypothetical protein
MLAGLHPGAGLLAALTAAAAARATPPGPFVLEAASLADARLVNVSSRPQYVLSSEELQPSALRLFGRDGAELRRVDERAIRKFSTDASRDMYRALAPGEKLALFEPRLRETENGYELAWGPFSFPELPPGRYRAELEWVSARNDYVDDDGKVRRLAGVWRGTVRSKSFFVAVP